MRSAIFAAVGFAVVFILVFAPVLFSGNFMTSGDGVVQAIPTYFGRTPLLEPKLMLGYPLFADPNQAFWYPVLRVMRAIPGAFNAYALFPYIAVAIGTYGFARRVSGTQAGAIAAGLIVALGGFMVSHQGHLMIIHPACWAPFVLWAFAELRERSSRIAIACGSIAFALGLTAGTQQPLLYLVFIGCAYAAVFRPDEHARRIVFFRDVAILVFAGFALAATALVPAGELALRSDRVRQTLAEFSVFSTAPTEFALRSVFPYVLGGSVSYARPFPEIGAYTEATNYAGILTLVLAIVALLDNTLRRRAVFWFGVALWSAWMALGQSLGAATIARLIPFYGSFRIPGRHAFEWTFAMAILASLGIAAMESGRVPWRNILIAVGGLTSVFAFALIAFAVDGHAILSAAAAQRLDVPTIPAMTVVTDRALAVPVAVMICACVLILLWKSFPTRFVSAIVILGVACDMLVFAYGSYWREYSAPQTIVRPPQNLADFRARLQRSGGRYIDLGTLTTHGITPNLATLWGLSNATGYVSLEDQTFKGFFDASPIGDVPSDNGLLTALDLTGVRYVLLPPDPPAMVPIAAALAGESIDGFIGDATIAPERSVTFAFSKPQAGNELQIVTALGNAVGIPNRTHVADLIVTGPRDRRIFPLLAGVDTSESAYDRPDVHSLMKHARSTIFSGSNDAHLYIASFALKKEMRVRSISVVWTATSASAALTVAHVALLDDARRVAYPFYADGRFAGDASHFVERPDAYHDGGERVLENLRAFPHVWIANKVVAAPPEVQLRAVHSGAIDGRAVDFHRTALSVAPVSLGEAAPGDRVNVVAIEPTLERDAVTCARPCLLVTNDLWYPGWDAAIDGAPARVLPVDYGLRGVVLPAGTHRVDLWFAPLSLRIGMAISLCAAVLLAAFLGRARFAMP